MIRTLLYTVAAILLCYVLFMIVKEKRFSVGDALATLAIIVTVILAQTSSNTIATANPTWTVTATNSPAPILSINTTATSTATGNSESFSSPTAEPTPALALPTSTSTVQIILPSQETATSINPTVGTSDVASANPMIVPPQQAIVAGVWDYVWDYGFGPLLRVGTGSYGGSTPARGQWLALTLAVANTSGQAQLIPDGFFVLKDGQNRVYDFNRAASAEWVARFGRGVVADTSADTLFTSTSEAVVLLFDIPSDATNLVLLSRANTTQGYLIR